MKRTLVTGAAGFTGRYLGPVLAGAGHEVHGLVHDLPLEPVEGFAAFHRADLTEPEAVRRAMEEVQPDSIVHLAAVAFVSHSDVAAMYKSNILGTRYLLDAAMRLDSPPQSILLASSANIYGNARAGVLDESTPPRPANDYGVTKLSMEYVSSLYAQALPIIIARPFNYTGRGQSSQFIVPKIVEHVRRSAPWIELGNLDVARDFSDVRTVVDAYARLLAEPDAIGETFNVCSGRAIALQEMLGIVERISGRHLEVRVNPEFVRANEVRSLCGSRAKLEQAIGPLLPISFEETLVWMLNA